MATWACVAGLVAGSMLPSWGRSTPAVGVILLTGLMVVVGRRNRWRLLGIALVALGSGAWSARAHAPVAPAAVEIASTFPKCTMTGRILEHAGTLGTVVAIARAECSEWGTVPELGPVIFGPLDHEAGSEIRAEGWLRRLTSDTFDSARERTGAIVAFEASRVVLEGPPAGLGGMAAKFRKGLAEATASLDPEQDALVRGLTIGDTSDISPSTENNFRRSGLAHLLAVSGSNVAIILGAVVLIAGGLSLVARVFLCATALCFFVLIVGPEPSVLRAAAMGVLGLLGIVVGRPTEPLQALGLAIALLLASRPHMAQSVALQLSAAATGGLILWTRSLAGWLERWLPGPLAFAIAAPVSAQTAVLPILAGVFGQISLVAPVANLVALPAVAPVTIVGLLAGALGSVAASLGSVLAELTGPFATWILWVARVAGSWSGAAVECPRWVGWVLAAPVVLVAAFTVRREAQVRED
jgi:competence protein ComEC